MCSLMRTFPLISSLSDEFDFLLYIPLFTSMWRLTRLFSIVGTLLSFFTCSCCASTNSALQHKTDSAISIG